MQLKTIDKRLEIALAPGERQIRYIPEDDLKVVLKYLFFLVGIRGHNLPVDDEKEFLHYYIRIHFGNHTAQEIRLAFDMAVQGRLDVDAKCYENFSAEYFSRIMGAYRKWAGKQELYLQNTHQEPPTYTADQILDIKIEYALYLFRLINKLPCKTVG